MLRILRIHRSRCEEFVSTLGVHHSQHRMLMYLARNSAPSQKELAAAFHISPAATAVTLGKLERGGYIKRVPQADDMRQNSIEITELGISVVDKSAEFFKGLDSSMFEGIDKDMLDNFNECLELILNNMKGNGKQ